MPNESFKEQSISHKSVLSNPSEETIIKIYKMCPWTKILLYKLYSCQVWVYYCGIIKQPLQHKSQNRDPFY